MGKKNSCNLIKILEDKYIYIPYIKGEHDDALSFVEFVRLLKKDGNEVYFDNYCFNMIIDGREYIMNIPEKKMYFSILEGMAIKDNLSKNDNDSESYDIDLDSFSSYLKKAYRKSKMKVIGDNVFIFGSPVGVLTLSAFIPNLISDKGKAGAVIATCYCAVSMIIASTMLLEVRDADKKKDLKVLYRQSLGKETINYNVIENIKRIKMYLDSLSGDNVEVYKKCLYEIYTEYVKTVKSFISMNNTLYSNNPKRITYVLDYKSDLEELEEIINNEFSNSKIIK